MLMEKGWVSRIKVVTELLFGADKYVQMAYRSYDGNTHYDEKHQMSCTRTVSHRIVKVALEAMLERSPDRNVKCHRALLRHLYKAAS